MSTLAHNLRVQTNYFSFLMGSGGVRRIWDHIKENVFFDIKYGTNTASWLPVEEFPQHIRNLEHGVRYRASYTSEVKRGIDQAIKYLGSEGYSEEQVHFTDIGCGKGKVIVQAAKEYDFKRVTGIDYNQDLLETATKNCKRAKARRVELTHADATTYNDFSEVNIVYLYNPFDEKILSKVIRNIILSDKKTVLIYNKPVHFNLFEGNVLWRTIEQKDGWSPDWTTHLYSFGFEEYQKTNSKYQIAA